MPPPSRPSSETGILLLTHFMVDMGDPGFRAGTYQHYLLPLARSLRQQLPAQPTRVLIARHTLDALRQRNQAGGDITPEDLVIDPLKRFDLFGSGDEFIGRAYRDSFTQHELSELEAYFRTVLNGFNPAVILCWEFPTGFLRRIFPDALVIDLMPGAFMRPPYPKTIAVDPWGIYQHSALRRLVGGGLRATDEEMRHHEAARKHHAGFFEEIHAREKILSLLGDVSRFSAFKLVPLQISSYFGFHANCGFRSQFDFLLHVLQTTAPDVGVIATQYTGTLTHEHSIHAGNVGFLRKHFPNFIYSEKFDQASNISQYIVPWVDEVCSISSTLGLQANFLGRKLSSPSTSHLSYLQDSALGIPRAEAAALIQSRYSLSLDSLLHEKGYLPRIIDHLKAVRGQPDSVYDGWPLTTEPAASRKGSTFKRATEIFQELGPFAGAFPTDEFLGEAREAIGLAETVSFDVFDTLVTRPVYFPRDIFLLIGCELRDRHHGLLPEGISPSLFASLRVSAEKTLRARRDAELGNAGCSLPEEITILEIYQTLLAMVANPTPGLAQRLVEIEAEVEFSLMGPLAAGVRLFHHAIAAGKRVIIISDFCHPKEFVEACLRKAGLAGYGACYVSSTSGPKKHSGNLYRLIAKELRIHRKTWLHIGDNPEGDILRARKAGLKTFLFPNFRKLASRKLAGHGVPERHHLASLAMRTAVSLFSERFTPGDLSSLDAEEIPAQNLFDSREQLGYLGIGPLIVSFGQWVGERALAHGCSQVIFFARDCHLPATVLEKLIGLGGPFTGLRSFYVPASRAVVRGFEFHSPEDVFKASLTDFAKSGKVGDALWRRFSINPAEVDPQLFEAHGITSADQVFEEVDPGSIYGVAYAHFKSHWPALSAGFSERRNQYLRMLAGSGIDVTAKTAMVDVGYSGTITRAVSGLFTQPVAALFITTYGDEFGRNPIRGGEAFLAARQRQAYTHNSPFLRHNLIMETLLNEPAGSLVHVGGDEESNSPDLIKETLPSRRHAEVVSQVQAGVAMFVDDWIAKLGSHGSQIAFESNVLMMMLHKFFEKPTVAEVRLIEDLVFDNGDAGYDTRSIASETESIWKAGEAALLEAGELQPASIPGAAKTLLSSSRRSAAMMQPNDKWPRLLLRIVTIHSTNEVRSKAMSNPRLFLARSKSDFLRAAGRLFYP